MHENWLTIAFPSFRFLSGSLANSRCKSIHASQIRRAKIYGRKDVMSYQKPTKVWANKDIERVIEVLAVIEDPEFNVATWQDHLAAKPDGIKVKQVPYPRYHPVVETLMRLSYNSSAYIDPYAVLPEDPAGSEPGIDLVQVVEKPQDLESATLDQIRRYLVLCTRGERFSDGYVARQFESGMMLAVRRRLIKLHKE